MTTSSRVPSRKGPTVLTEGKNLVNRVHGILDGGSYGRSLFISNIDSKNLMVYNRVN